MHAALLHPAGGYLLFIVKDVKDGTNYNTLYKVTVYIVCHVEGVEDSTDT